MAPYFHRNDRGQQVRTSSSWVPWSLIHSAFPNQWNLHSVPDSLFGLSIIPLSPASSDLPLSALFPGLELSPLTVKQNTDMFRLTFIWNKTPLDSAKLSFLSPLLHYQLLYERPISFLGCHFLSPRSLTCSEGAHWNSQKRSLWLRGRQSQSFISRSFQTWHF